MPLAQTAGKPMFLPTPADGAIRATSQQPESATETSLLAETILAHGGIRQPRVA